MKRRIFLLVGMATAAILGCRDVTGGRSPQLKIAGDTISDTTKKPKKPKKPKPPPCDTLSDTSCVPCDTITCPPPPPPPPPPCDTLSDTLCGGDTLTVALRYDAIATASPIVASLFQTR